MAPDAALGTLVFSARDSAGKDHLSRSVERLEAKTETQPGGGLHGLMEVSVIHWDFIGVKLIFDQLDRFGQCLCDKIRRFKRRL